MGIGVLGILMVVAGAILMWALTIDLSFVDDDTLGLILFIVGILTIVLAIVLNIQQGKTKHIEERRYDENR